MTHFAWVPEARLNGVAPLLTIAAGVAHGVAGAVTGRRLVDSTRPPTSGQAGVLGAATSLLALVLFTPPFTLYVMRGLHMTNPWSYLWLTLWTGLFSFLGAGWALLLVSVGVGWAIHHVARLR